MKLLLFSDVHCDLLACARLVEMSQQADLVIGAGDFANMRHGLQGTIDALSPISTPTVLVAGNGETDEELQAACAHWPAAVVLHGSGAHRQGCSIWGLGGAVPPTPFGDWSFDLSEDVAASMLHGGQGHTILVVHSPPKGYLDVDTQGCHLGSRAVYDFLRKWQPELVVCGHVHACNGQQVKLGSTTIVNAGPQGVWLDWIPPAGMDSSMKSE